MQIEAALALRKLGAHDKARELLRQIAAFGDVEERKAALNAMAEWGDRDAFAFIASEMNDLAALPAVRRAAALALAACGSDAIPTLLPTLADEDSSVREGAAFALARLGEDSLPSLLAALEDLRREHGALTALAYLPVAAHTRELKEFAARKIQSALHYDDLARSTKSPDIANTLQSQETIQKAPGKAPGSASDRLALLKESLRTRALRDGLAALRATGLVSDRVSIKVAIENLQSREATQRANALETLESVRESRLIRPLLHLWESHETQITNSGYAQKAIFKLLADPDTWLRACAAFAIYDLPEARIAVESLAFSEDNPLVSDFYDHGEPMDTRTTLPLMERVLLLRRVPLLADLTPNDLQRVASLTTEHHIETGEALFEQGDPGNEMYVIVHGQVKVMVRKDEVEKEFVRRGVGEVIGEMSLISGDPRVAAVLATEELHLLCLDRKNFEGLLRERPEVALAVMRVLCARLKEATR
ncbi:MAG: cyclic nucleotide-binding domain-containing protein [Chloroflexi bacterium]|nr:cyclic nucleotide-binding domain-containing protein [Chloroflexota bacterium]